MAAPFEQLVGVDAVFLRQLGDGYARFAGLLRQAQFEFDRMIRPAFACRPFGFIGQFGSHHFFGGNHFRFFGYRRPDGSGKTLTVIVDDMREEFPKRCPQLVACHSETGLDKEQLRELHAQLSKYGRP
jgi:hypothetical protein